jgi:hypothetical protein
MAKMDSGDMIAYVRQSIGSPPTSEIGDDDILRRLNQVYMRLGTQLPMPELYTSTTITTSSGTAAYSVGTGVLVMLDIANSTDGTTMRWITPNQYEKYYAADTTTGSPQFGVQSYSSTNATTFVKLYPTPDGVYTIRVGYRKEPTELVTSPADNYTDYSDSWDEVICMGAAASCALQMGDYQRAGALKQEYQQLIGVIYPAQIKATQQVTRLRAPWGVSLG